MVFRFLVSQNQKVLPNPEAVEHKHFLSMSKIRWCWWWLWPSSSAWWHPGLAEVHRPSCAQTKHGLYLQSSMRIFLVLQDDIARGKKKILSSKFQHPGFLPAAAVLSVGLLNYTNIAFDLERKMSSKLSNYMMFNWKLNIADVCFPLKQSVLVLILEVLQCRFN